MKCVSEAIRYIKKDAALVYNERYDVNYYLIAVRLQPSPLKPVYHLTRCR